MEDSKLDPIKHDDKPLPISREKSITMRKDPNLIKTEERFTSQQSNQDYIDEGNSNYEGTLSKASNTRKVSSKKSQNYFRNKNKKSIKEELQMLQDIRDLEKEKEVLERQNTELLERLDHLNKDSIKWKSAMVKKIVELEDQIQRLKNASMADKTTMKDEYARDLMKVSKLSKQRELNLVESIRDEIRSEYLKCHHELKVKYTQEVESHIEKLDKVQQKYLKVKTKEEELRFEYNRFIKEQEFVDFKKNWYGTFVVAFEDNNITLERFKHFLKISLHVENNEFHIHGLKKEKVVGASLSTNASKTSAFNEDSETNEILKIYVSFHTKNASHKAIEYLKTLSVQVKAGKCKLNMINPFYLGINFGKISINSKDYTKISLAKWDLLYREGLYITNTFLLCSIYKFTNEITNEICIKILAFDNGKGIEYIIDLEYQDLLEMTESNVHILNSNEDLTNFLSNGLAYFENSNEDQFLVFENRLYFSDYTGLNESMEQKSSKDVTNQLLLSKNNKRDKMLHEDVGTSTDLHMNIIHEAFDMLFDQVVHVYNCRVKIFKGRLSSIIIIEFIFATQYTYKLVLYESMSIL